MLTKGTMYNSTSSVTRCNIDTLLVSCNNVYVINNTYLVTRRLSSGVALLCVVLKMPTSLSFISYKH